jgi:hypothetical protein
MRASRAITPIVSLIPKISHDFGDCVACPQLIGKDFAAIGADPGNVVAGHSPQILIHACLADQESTGTAPVEAAAAPAANTVLQQSPIYFPGFPSAGAHLHLRRFHNNSIESAEMLPIE